MRELHPRQTAYQTVTLLTELIELFVDNGRFELPSSGCRPGVLPSKLIAQIFQVGCTGFEPVMFLAENHDVRWEGIEPSTFRFVAERSDPTELPAHSVVLYVDKINGFVKAKVAR